MIRPLTLICAAVAGISGLYLYHVKHQTQLLERRIARTNQSIEAARERAGVLRAEWTLMNDPERLAELAGQFLKLVTVAPRQFTTVADLGARLPAVRTLPVRPEVSTDMPIVDAPADATDPSVETPLPLPPPAPPRAVAAATPALAPRPATAPVPAVGTAAGATVVAGAPVGAAPVVAVPVVAVPVGAAPVVAVPVVAVPVAAARAPVPQPAPSRPVVQASPQPAPVLAQRSPPAPPVVGPAVSGAGSALGMARGIVAPPVPVGGGEIHLTRGN